MNRILTTLAGLTFCMLAAASEPPPLKNNPFSRPPAPVVVQAVSFSEEQPDAPLQLFATMVSSSGTYANVEGQVIRPGQELRGYLLKRVFEDRAVFELKGDELTVYVKPELEEDYEQPMPNRRHR